MIFTKEVVFMTRSTGGVFFSEIDVFQKKIENIYLGFFRLTL